MLRGGPRALALAAAASAIAASAASAHVTIAPAASRPADLQRYRLLVPNESTDGKATTGVDVQLPPGITFALADAQPPWKVALVRRGGEIAQIRWSGGSIPVDGYGELEFIARNPVRAGAATFKTLQRYAGGEVVRWIGSPDSDTPSPTVQITERAVPQDVVSVHGGKAPASGPAASAPAAAGADARGGSSTTATAALIAGLLALVVAAASLALAVRRRAPRPG
ncbi:MAG: hypothetical protein QOG35_1010 [Solirubrobacteraceae bacterium]|nr:hypothetical protein [Solirubrobacteraceae bacterium]